MEKLTFQGVSVIFDSLYNYKPISEPEVFNQSLDAYKEMIELILVSISDGATKDKEDLEECLKMKRGFIYQAYVDDTCLQIRGYHKEGRMVTQMTYRGSLIEHWIEKEIFDNSRIRQLPPHSIQQMSYKDYETIK